MSDRHPHQPPPRFTFPPGMVPPPADGPPWHAGTGTGIGIGAGAGFSTGIEAGAGTGNGAGAGAGTGTGWFGRLTGGQRVGLLVGGGALTLVLLCCGGLTVIGATADPPKEPKPAAAGGVRDQGLPVPAVTSAPPATESAPATGAPAPSPSPSASPTPTPSLSPSPVVRTRTVTSTETIRHGSRTVKDSSLAKGTRKVRTRGVDGVRTLTYQVTVTDGVQTGRKLVKSVVTRQPVTEVVAVGTKVARECDPNYSGCVPIASDVDCAGGGGDGPAYVSGPVRVIGSDVYRLDRDKDGWACED
ncbi:G5 domain-containing protein [Micromonospora sp. WMMD882]|uniref:G5 domain-containing protein n=1 Tax=Micromonospora sp. WMMD882 TaxID=3015151 RepID=UPI00248C2B32|nr:G5 domain-containing protein [Micromonospora sp. WMMD882]WBB77364.1 G5 domain-containing protein [Micromonospora sp. WMMD882]